MHIEYRAEFRCTPEQLWPFLDEPEKQKLWLTTLVDIVSTSRHPCAVGATFDMQAREGRRISRYEGRINAYDPPRHLGVSFWGGSFGRGVVMRVDYRLADLGARTRLRIYAEVDTDTLPAPSAWPSPWPACSPSSKSAISCAISSASPKPPPAAPLPQPLQPHDGLSGAASAAYAAAVVQSGVERRDAPIPENRHERSSRLLLLSIRSAQCLHRGCPHTAGHCHRAVREQFATQCRRLAISSRNGRVLREHVDLNWRADASEKEAVECVREKRRPGRAANGSSNDHRLRQGVSQTPA